MMRNFVAMITPGRVGAPIECAKLIAFLASDAASYVAGQTIEVNGGPLMLQNSKLADPAHYWCGIRVALTACPAEARSDLGCGGR
jgi:Enoyl-(Acyl carrier protein) reductase